MIKTFFIQFYYKLLFFIFRGHSVIFITWKCPLRDDCKAAIKLALCIKSPIFNFNDILDVTFRAVGRHLEAEHKIGTSQFVGLQFKTDDLKYTIYLGAQEHR